MKSLFVIALLSLFAVTFSASTERFDDAHLNAVLPDAESSVAKQTVEPDAETIPIVPVTESDSEPTTARQATTITTDSTYFSRIITSIFEIPISVLTAVRNLLNNAAIPKPATAVVG